jgi:integrase
MATVRKRILPRTREVRWQVDYRDQQGKRRAKQFKTKADAVSYETKVRGEIVAGIHVADSASITVKEAADIWLAACEANGLEEATTRAYRNHVNRHIVPLLGEVRLSRLTTPVAQDFVERLAKDRSRVMVAKVTNSLKQIVNEMMRRGRAATNPVLVVRLPDSARDEEPPEFPTAEEIKLLLERASGDLRPLIHTGMLTGMRPSELRGLTWEHVDFKEGMIRVRQRADRLGKIGRPKSKAGRRDIPIGPHLVSLLREWKLKCPRRDKGKKDDDDPGVLEFVFPDASGNVEDHTTIYRRFGALQLACGIDQARLGPDGKPRVDEAGKPERQQKYGLHAMRHACASLLIAQGWQPKRIQVFLGHASIKLTFDTYGHLFKDAEGDQKAMAKLEGALLG